MWCRFMQYTLFFNYAMYTGILIHYASHKLNLCIAQALVCVKHVRSIASFLNFSPICQHCLEEHVQQYCDSLKSKLLPLCQTRWVQRIDALEVAIDLLKAVVNTFRSIIENSGTWNRETISLASSLLNCIDFEFVINLFVAQTSGCFPSPVV